MYTAFLMLQHVVESQQFDRDLLKELFALATKLEQKRYGSLAGKIMATLFYEPSTRARFSFELVMLQLGGDVIATENVREFSSAAKGERKDIPQGVCAGTPHPEPPSATCRRPRLA